MPPTRFRASKPSAREHGRDPRAALARVAVDDDGLVVRQLIECSTAPAASESASPLVNAGRRVLVRLADVKQQVRLFRLPPLVEFLGVISSGVFVSVTVSPVSSGAHTTSYATSSRIVGRIAADRARRIARQRDLPEAHPQRVIEQQRPTSGSPMPLRS